MKRTVVLFLTFLAALSSSGQNAVGEPDGWPMNQYYVGAEADVGGTVAACIVGGAYYSGVNVELRLRYPLGTKRTAYYNLPIRYGSSREMELRSGCGFEVLAGYGLPFADRFRLTPSAGIRYTPIKGWTTDWSLSEQAFIRLLWPRGIESRVRPFALLHVSRDARVCRSSGQGCVCPFV